VANFVVVYDACVLYPAPLRDLLLRLAGVGLFRARWTDEIHEEWMRNVLRDRRDLNPELLERTRRLMDRAVPDCLVTGYQGLIEQVELPDLDDRHVLAAAIRCQASAIVTYNLRDFPKDHLTPYGIEPLHPDDFVAAQFELAPATVGKTVRDQRLSSRNPKQTVRELLDTFLSLGLASSLSALETIQDLL